MATTFDILCDLLSPVHSADSLRSAAGGVPDWDPIRHGARLRGLQPLLARVLDRAGALKGLPAAARDEMMAAAAIQSARSESAIRLLGDMLDLLAKAGIDALALKGPVTSRRAYGDPHVRTFADLDLLVDPRGRKLACDALGRLGFENSFSGLPGDGLFFSPASDIVLQRPGDGFRVDLCRAFDAHHFRLKLSFPRLLEKAEFVDAGVVPLRTMGPEDEFLYLCYHGTKHAWYRLQWALDIAWLAGRPESVFDWTRLWREAEKAGGATAMSTGLCLAADLFGAPFPAPALARARGNRIAVRLAAEAARRLCEESGPADSRTTSRFEWAATPTGLPKMRYAARLLFGPTPSDYRWIPLPRPFFPLYRLLRPVRLAASHLIRRRPRVDEGSAKS